MTSEAGTLRRKEAEPIIPYLAEEAMEPECRETLQRASQMLGVFPNAGRTYAHRPDIAKLIDSMYLTIVRSDRSNLDLDLKNKLGVICSSVNGCVYCTSHQCSLVQKPRGQDGSTWGLSDDEVVALISGGAQGRDEAERLCFEFARTASRSPTGVPVELLEKLKAHFSPPQIVELGCVVSMWKFFNTMHDCLHIPSEGAMSHYWNLMEAGHAASHVAAA